MISKQMYKILQKIPHSPERITLKELRKKVKIDVSVMWSILEDAMNCNYIVYASRNPYNDIQQSPFYLTEAGQIEIEEYGRENSSSKKATWALVISGLSFLASVAAVIVACIVK